MSTQVLVLAAGEARRIGRIKKQLLRPTGQWTLIERICNQVKERGHIPLVVTHDPEIGMGQEWGKPRARRWTAETLQSTEQLWRERTVVLLGDVVYSRDCMNRIFREPASFMVFGHEYEVFGIVFRLGVWDQMKLALEMAVKHAELGGPGKLRTVYQAFCGLEMGGNAREDDHWHRICYVADYTMDVDTPEDWEILLRKARQNRIRN